MLFRFIELAKLNVNISQAVVDCGYVAVMFTVNFSTQS